MQAEPTLGRKIVFTLIADLAILLLLEGLLALAGVRPLLWDEDPFVGFSSHLPLFVPEGDRLVTAPNKLDFFNRQSFPASKADGTFRIFCLGGSTTYGRPFAHATSFCGWLEQLLPLADPSQRWEVVNAGGISYASYRVARLMEELAGYEPDLFLVYSGHNEFLERRTYRELMEMPAWLRETRRLLSRTRIFTVLQRGWDRVRRRDRTVLSGEVDTILDRSVGPSAYTRDDELRRRIVEHYRLNVARMVDIARAAGAAVLFVNPASNLLDSAPFKSEPGPGLDPRDRRRWQELWDQVEEDPPGSLELLERLVELDPRHAEAHFRHGRALAAEGRHAEARAALERARDEDVCPLRALGEIERALREQAEAYGVPLVDYRELVDEQARHRLPGADLFLDHVHPTLPGHRLLAVELVEELHRLGTLPLSSGWNAASIERVAQRIEAGIDPGQQADALANLARVLAWAGQHEEGRRLAHQALELDPEHLGALYFAGDGEVQAGRFAEAETLFRRVVQLRPGHHHGWNGLGVAMLRQQRAEEALSAFERALQIDPHSAPAWLNRGQAQEALGGLESAESSYRRTLELDPRNAAARFQLGSLLLGRDLPGPAIPELEAAVALAPERPELHHRLGVAYDTAGRTPEAEGSFRAVVRLDPRSAAAHGDLGRLLARLGRMEEAEAELRMAVELEPERAERRRELAQALLDLGRSEEAAGELERALELDPGLEAARRMLERIALPR